jgi:hypothetical protein
MFIRKDWDFTTKSADKKWPKIAKTGWVGRRPLQLRFDASTSARGLSRTPWGCREKPSNKNWLGISWDRLRDITNIHKLYPLGKSKWLVNPTGDRWDSKMCFFPTGNVQAKKMEFNHQNMVKLFTVKVTDCVG